MMVGALTGNSCLVEKKINNKLLKIKQYFKYLNEMYAKNWLGSVASIKGCCDTILNYDMEIRELALILHPEYEFAEIDSGSFQDFLEKRGKLVRIIFFNDNRNDYAVRYFKPEEK